MANLAREIEYIRIRILVLRRFKSRRYSRYTRYSARSPFGFIYRPTCDSKVRLLVFHVWLFKYLRKFRAQVATKRLIRRIPREKAFQLTLWQGPRKTCPLSVNAIITQTIVSAHRHASMRQSNEPQLDVHPPKAPVMQLGHGTRCSVHLIRE